MYKIKPKLAVITGGAMGIGLATAKRLLREGAGVIILDINAKALEDAVENLKSLGTVYGFQCDITDKAQVYSLAKKITAEIGNVSILVNNAGTVVGGDFLERSIVMSLVGSLGSGASAATKLPFLIVTNTRLFAGTSILPVILPLAVMITPIPGPVGTFIFPLIIFRGDVGHSNFTAVSSPLNS